MLSKRREGAFGRKSLEYKWDERCINLIQTTLTGAGADITTLVGVKPTMPACWDGKSFPSSLPRLGDACEIKESSESSEKPKKAKRKYLMVSDEIKYQFFDLHRDLKHDTWKKTVCWVNEHLPQVYGLESTVQGGLTVDIVKKWKNKFGVRPPRSSPPVEHVAGKKGPKKRELKLGEFVPWHNARVSVATHICLAALLVAQVGAGIPLSTPTILCCASAVFASAGVKWEPSRSWARTFAGRIGLSMRAGTRAARHLPVDFKRIARVHVLRFVWLVSTYGLLPWAVFNMDETGIRFVPLKNRTWAEKGAKQVEITSLDEKRQFTAFPVINAAGETCGRVQITWQGNTRKSCPSSECQARYVDLLTHEATPSHWSTTSTVEAAVDDLLSPNQT